MCWCYLFKMIGVDDAIPLKSGHMTDIYRTALYNSVIVALHSLYGDAQTRYRAFIWVA